MCVRLCAQQLCIISWSYSLSSSHQDRVCHREGERGLELNDFYLYMCEYICAHSKIHGRASRRDKEIERQRDKEIESPRDIETKR